MNLIRVNNLDDEELSVYVGLNEKQLKRFYEPAEGLFICESSKVIRRALAAGYEAESFFVEEGKLNEAESFFVEEGKLHELEPFFVEEEKLGEKKMPEEADAAGTPVYCTPYSVVKDTPVYCAPYSVMKDITGYALTGGILAAMKRKPPRDPEEIIGSGRNLVILNDIENPTNVGAIFRSAVALGADAVLLTEGCADPLYRRAARVSMGTVFQIDWTFIESGFIRKLKDSGFATYALALSDDAVPLDGIERSVGKKAVILGNEDHGISKEILDMCDISVIIPMKHNVDSLNVAAASAVAFWELFN